MPAFEKLTGEIGHAKAQTPEQMRRHLKRMFQ